MLVFQLYPAMNCSRKTLKWIFFEKMQAIPSSGMTSKLRTYLLMGPSVDTGFSCKSKKFMAKSSQSMARSSPGGQQSNAGCDHGPAER
jgi:hypothetical protein